MKCAHCKERDVTIQHVKVCAYEEQINKGQQAVKPVALKAQVSDEPDLMAALAASIREVKEMELDEEEQAAARLDSMTGAHGRDMASEKQVAYVIDLLLEHEWPDTLTAADVENMERRQVTKLIDALKSSPLKSEAGVLTPTGRYCLVIDPGDDGVSYSYVDRQDLVPPRRPKLGFYEVTRRDEGRWAGRTWVAQLFGAPGDYRREPVRGAAMVRVLTEINKDPQAASIRYGKESGVCGVCHSPLTNKDSLARGIGPICAGKRGW